MRIDNNSIFHFPRKEEIAFILNISVQSKCFDNADKNKKTSIKNIYKNMRCQTESDTHARITTRTKMNFPFWI